MQYYFGKSNFQQEEGSFHQQIGLIFKKETSKVLHWSRALNGAETWKLRGSRSAIRGKF
jgi:hypothetical protein